MKITLFTSNNKRHNYLINLLSEICDELFVIQECGSIFPGIMPGHYQASETMKNYFEKVNDRKLRCSVTVTSVIHSKILKFYQC